MEPADPPGAELVNERLWRKTKVTDSGCYEWQGSVDAGGYGKIRIRKFLWRIHRLAYLVFKGPAPLLVCHSCDNRRCWNPDHLWLGTHKDNTQDSIRKGRFNKVRFNLPAVSRRVTCPKGHDLLVEGNVYRDGKCRTCTKDKAAEKRTLARLSPVCPNGHPYTPDNVLIRKDGFRTCAICRRTSRWGPKASLAPV